MPKPSPFSSHLRRFLLQSPTACRGPSSCRQLHHSFRLLEASSSQSGEQPSESTESSSPLSGTSPPAPPIHFRLSPLNDDLLMSEDQPTAGSSRPGAMGNEESLAGRRGPPKEKKKYPFMDKDTMDEMLGIDTLHRTGSSSRALRDDDG